MLGNRTHEALGTASLAHAAGKHKDPFKQGGRTLPPKAVLWLLHVCGAMCVPMLTWICTRTCIQYTYHTYIVNTHACTQKIIRNYDVKGEARKLGNWKKTQWCEDTASMPTLTQVCELCTWQHWSTGNRTGSSAHRTFGSVEVVNPTGTKIQWWKTQWCFWNG